jgi:hypothetical protein
MSSFFRSAKAGEGGEKGRGMMGKGMEAKERWDGLRGDRQDSTCWRLAQADDRQEMIATMI